VGGRRTACAAEQPEKEDPVVDRASTRDLSLEREFAEGASRFWWLFLITGILWLWVSLIVLRLNLESVTAIAVLFGVVAIAAGINEFFAIPPSSTGWKIVHGLLGAIFIVAGVVAFFEPAGTFVALASIVGWVLLFKGIVDITLALTNREAELWWLTLVVGIAEIALAFWAVGYFRGSAILLVAWIGAVALVQGITEILRAFRLRSLKKQLAEPTPT
jgi:uncharacterized membrane protein HdeD (DUF308 family)